MTFIQRIDALALRFLSSRTYELIVAPAIADVQYDDRGGLLARARNRLSLVVALAGAACEELTADSLLTLAGLALIPAAYYTFLVVFCLPSGPGHPSAQISGLLSASVDHLGIVALLVAVSCAPVIACCWPDKTDA